VLSHIVALLHIGNLLVQAQVRGRLNGDEMFAAAGPIETPGQYAVPFAARRKRPGVVFYMVL
jgi:hypothetical protein